MAYVKCDIMSLFTYVRGTKARIVAYFFLFISLQTENGVHEEELVAEDEKPVLKEVRVNKSSYTLLLIST